MAVLQLPPGANFAEAAPTFLSEADILAVLDRVMPEWYLEPLKSPGPGYEWFQALAQALSRVSLAVARTDSSMSVIYSHGGALSTALVEFFRPTIGTGQFIIKAGTIVRTSVSNRSYQVVADLTMGSGALTVQGLVQAVAPAYEYDVPGPVTTADGTVLPGEIDSVVIPILDPVFAEPSIQVRQLVDATGGKSPVLDQLGLDRNIGRRPGEDDATYKGRIRQLPDTVSPAALRRQLDAIFVVMGLEYSLIETWESRYQTCWDAPDSTISGATGDVAADVFVYDDTRQEPFRGRWMDEHDHVAGLVLVVPETGAWSDRSLAYDDDGSVVTTFGWRSTSAYDAPDADVSTLLRVPAYDGVDVGHQLFYKHLSDLMRQIKGGGTNVAIELKGQ